MRIGPIPCLSIYSAFPRGFLPPWRNAHVRRLPALENGRLPFTGSARPAGRTPCEVVVQRADEPCGSLKTETFLRLPQSRGPSHYLASNLPANTKYSVNRQFIPVRHFSLSSPKTQNPNASAGLIDRRKCGQNAHSPGKRPGSELSGRTLNRSAWPIKGDSFCAVKDSFA